MNRVTHIIPWAHTGPTQLKFGEKTWRERLRERRRRKKEKEKKKKEEKEKKKRGNGAGRSKLGQRRNSWQWAKHVWLYPDPLQALKGEYLSALGSQQKGP